MHICPGKKIFSETEERRMPWMTGFNGENGRLSSRSGRVSVTDHSAVSTEGPLLKPNRFRSRRRFHDRNSVICFKTTLSMFLDRSWSQSGPSGIPD